MGRPGCIRCIGRQTTRERGSLRRQAMVQAAPPAPRVKAASDRRTQRLTTAQQAAARAALDREARPAQFTRACANLRAVWGPRLEEYARQFGDQIKVTPSLEPARREAKLIFLTDRANMTLTLTASPNSDVTKVVLDYELLIIPILFDYQRHARLEMPLDQIDREAVGAWIDDQLVSCVKIYLSLQDNEHYIKRAMVEDPISKARFLKADAA